MGKFALPVLFLSSGAVYGQIPVNSQTQDYITPVTSAINTLVTGDGNTFLSTGNQLLSAIAVIMLVVYGLKWAAASAARHHAEFDFPSLIHFFAVFLIAEALLRYYSTPLPWTSVSVHQIFPETGRQLAATIDISTLNRFVQAVQGLVTGEQRPSFFDPIALFVYWTILIDMIVIEGLLFALNILAFVMLGIGSLLGPLFIPWLVVSRLNWLFWNWIQFMLQYSFFQVVAAALTNVWAVVLLNFINNAVHGDYSLAHLLLILVPLGLLQFGFVVCVLQSRSIVTDLFRGTVSAGGNLASGLSGMVRGAF